MRRIMRLHEIELDEIRGEFLTDSPESVTLTGLVVVVEIEMGGY